ncbi:MAG TPA: sigma-70 family RNA polymerase sigma factor, partial [Devosia sp.]|nr:sigma-70 family RNA polymerase sigma factor [Devosia sp.]
MAADTAQIADLISRCALRDRAAFRELYTRTSAKLFGVTLRILRDRSEAEEALQEVYVKIWQRADRYVPGGYSPISWLVAVARNHALDVLRARKP